MSDNPYKTPESTLGEENELSVLVYAGKGRRILNLFIDYFGMIVVAIAFFIVVGVFAGEQAIDGLPDIVVGLGAMFVYYIPMEAIFGRTFGKMVTGTKVVGENGERASFGQIVGRTVCRMIPFEAFSYLGANTRGWHDSIPHTRVVRCR